MSTGLPTLDRAVVGKSADSEDIEGGLPCGQVTEIYGPPGAGKTVFAFHHFTAPTLPHLLALLIYPTPSFPPKGTSLLVVDSVSVPFNHAFAQSNGHERKTDVAQWASGRRWAVMGDLISAIGKLAATRNITALLINQTTTKLKLESAAWLQPAMTGAAWDAGIQCRILLFRDWQMRIDDESSQEQGGYAAVVKVGDGPVKGFGEIVPFAIEQVRKGPMCIGPTDGIQFGLRETNDVVAPVPPAVVMHEPTAPRQTALKRKRNEIADSASEGEMISDDDFGWTED
ncbi:MAG: hypothetical protein LQ348_006095 [Seirophora lacunosa]|nr:MAG: hypothetical protein LQ348_006095 [Seirophora lacunosa]